MSELNKKLLAEAFDAFVSENDIAKATRLFQRHWNLVAKNNFALLESEDEDFEVTDLGGDFNQEIVDDAGSDKEQKFEQLQIAVDELEDKYPTEMTEEVQAKFDELRNKIDEMKLAGEEDEVSDEDATVIIEDLKADFEVAGEISEEVEALFKEKLTQYLKEIAFKDTYVSSARLGNILLDTTGVFDYADFKVNGVMNNIELSDTDVPKVGEFTFSYVEVN